MEDAPRKVDRDEVYLEYAKSICPVCKRVIDGEVNVRDGRVFLRKRCRDHGSFEALVYGDAEMYFRAMRFNKPGTIPHRFQTEVREGCPLDCGLCTDHKQHACVGLIDVNSDCNLDCPICFADSGHQPDGFSLTMEQVDACLDAFVEAEGEPEVVMLSGGEPTIHPRILDFMARAKERGVQTVVLNTNGLRLASDRDFVERVRALGDGVGIYLQFDGLERETHLAIRGKDLRRVKERALENCAEAGLTVALVAALERGVNDHEVGEIVRFGIEHPAVRATIFQPVTHSGRHLAFDPRERLTNSDVIHEIADRLPEWFRSSDFFPVPCCFPTCRSITYALADGDTVVPVTRLVDVEDHLDYVTNRALPDPSAREALEKLWSAGALAGTPLTDGNLDRLGCSSCCTPSEVFDVLSEKAFMIMVQDFQDPYTLNVKQLMKCCVMQLVPDGRIIPFCAYNSVGYREQVRAELGGVPVDGVVPNARELDLVETPYGSKTHVDAPGRPGADVRNIGRRLR